MMTYPALLDPSHVERRHYFFSNRPSSHRHSSQRGSDGRSQGGSFDIGGHCPLERDILQILRVWSSGVDFLVEGG